MINNILTEYICVLSMKKNAVLLLAAAQVACEESEVMLLEVYSAAQLNHIHNSHYTIDNPKSALGQYFNAASHLCFDSLEL